MLPKTGTILKQDFEIVTMPSKTFRIEENRIVGYTDGLEAVRQAVEIALRVERFEWLIYSWNYGVELKKLFGKPMGLVKSKLKKQIKDALMRDDRITGVDAFSFETSGRKLHVTFTVHTVFGDLKGEKELDV